MCILPVLWCIQVYGMSSRTDGSHRRQYIILFPQSLKQELALLVEDLRLLQTPSSRHMRTCHCKVPCTYTPCNT